MRRRHPLKEVEDALQYAELKRCTVIVERSHWGIIRCPLHTPDGCQVKCLINSEECGQPWSVDSSGSGPLSTYKMNNEHE